MHVQGIRALAAVSGADMTIGVMCTLRGAQATEKAARLGLFLMCKLRFEEYQPTDFQQKPTRHGPTGHKPATKFSIRTKANPYWRIRSVVMEVEYCVCQLKTKCFEHCSL